MIPVGMLNMIQAGGRAINSCARCRASRFPGRSGRPGLRGPSPGIFLLTGPGGGADAMTITAWRFRGTEEADQAVLKLKQLSSQDQIELQDITVLRWPQYAATPRMDEHVTDDGGKMSSLVSKLKTGHIESAMIESVKSDMMPGTSALVLMSADAAVETVAKAFEGQPMELIRSDLSVQRQDQLRAAFGDPSQPGNP
jgi:uncharacterized membrane protein